MVGGGRIGIVLAVCRCSRLNTRPRIVSVFQPSGEEKECLNQIDGILREVLAHTVTISAATGECSSSTVYSTHQDFGLGLRPQARRTTNRSWRPGHCSKWRDSGYACEYVCASIFALIASAPLLMQGSPLMQISIIGRGRGSVRGSWPGAIVQGAAWIIIN